jgi:hypothetical protein
VVSCALRARRIRALGRSIADNVGLSRSVACRVSFCHGIDLSTQIFDFLALCARTFDRHGLRGTSWIGFFPLSAGSPVSLPSGISRVVGPIHCFVPGTLVVSLLALAVVGLLFFITIDGVRGFKAGGRFEITVNLPRLDKYFFGALPVFTYWFHTYSEDTPTFGAYTFAGVFRSIRNKAARNWCL